MQLPQLALSQKYHNKYVCIFQFLWLGLNGTTCNFFLLLFFLNVAMVIDRRCFLVGHNLSYYQKMWPTKKRKSTNKKNSILL